MARTGIVYSHVANAAAQLVADGKNPTVDSVREALGSTGSKSTIAPLLKRWKTDHQDLVTGTESGLPSALLQAMKGVHDKLQEDVQQQLEQARDAHHIALQLASAATEQAEGQNRILLDSKAALSAELQELRGQLATLQTDHQKLGISNAGVQGDNAGLQHRLSDRATEIAGLNLQLAQSRAQFDHYVAAAVEQRAQERQAADQQLMRLERNLADARQQLLQQQATVAQQETQMTHLQAQYSELQQTTQALQATLESCRSERDRLSYQHAHLSSAVETQAHQLDAARESVIATRIQLATQEREMALMSERAAQDANHLKELDEARLALFQEHAKLQAQVLHDARQDSELVKAIRNSVATMPEMPEQPGVP